MTFSETRERVEVGVDKAIFGSPSEAGSFEVGTIEGV